VTPRPLPSAAPRPGTHVDRSAAIYGSLLITTLVAVEGRHDASAELLALSVLVAVVAFWLMEVWSELVNLRVRGPISAAAATIVARNESPMLLAAVVPALVLATPRLGLLGVDDAITLALGVCIVQLFLWGLGVGLAIGRGWVVALATAAGDVLLGLLIVGFKIMFVH
jgi:hypothetical protein